MLAATVEDVETLRYPLFASPKLDGVRACVYNRKVWSRSAKLIPNQHVQMLFSELEGFDGELIVGAPNASDVYRKTVSGVMTANGEPEVAYYVFDHTTNQGKFLERLECIPLVYRLQHILVNSPLELLGVELTFLSQGYEGVILRDPEGLYKNGRSTLRQQWMLKLKRFTDAEAKVVDMEEFMHNDNPLGTNELGYAHRTSHKENQRRGNKLGALVCQWEEDTFKIGTGFTDAERIEIWQHKELHMGRLAKFKYLPVGVKDKPRHPVFLGWRPHGT